MRLAVKALELVREVATSASVEAPLLDTVIERMGEISATHGDDDLAAVYELPLDGHA